jgi:hypothetical protein
MDSPNVARYYQEMEPIKRKKLLKLIAEEEGSQEEKAIRQELFDVRYAGRSQANRDMPADGFLGLWMMMEYNCSAGPGLFGMNIKKARKEVGRGLEKLKIREYYEKGGLYRELLDRELQHMVRTYMNLCKTDRTYNSTLFGLMKMKEEQSAGKLKNDVNAIITRFPRDLQMEEELKPVIDAAKTVYEEFFPRDILDDVEV